ncbi:hypothetical protein Sipo8835_24425 [Streptomyces ipomoeae]|uniref:Uncharacterized protein n=1 Tax=Streptomyces ipomoeae TaxID=103232 RepID=A0AAE8VZJ7_9ACTN|nr:hypothetical protein Sipo8835_24425 [Streptomyces ipomoeae]TQE34221.1 hypothetical protein Sipo7851_18250 [Streptomyces ipomoeae]
MHKSETCWWLPRTAPRGRLRQEDDPLAPPAGRGPGNTAAPPLGGRATQGCPPIRGVIVLTVKLFGETLKAPRTLAVWHG